MGLNLKLAVVSCFYLFIITPSFAEDVYLEKILGEQDGQQYDAKIISYSRDGEHILFTSNAVEIPRVENIDNRRFWNALFVKQVASDEISQITLMENDEIKYLNIGATSNLTSSNQVYFRSEGNGAISGLYFYSFDDNSIGNIPLPENGDFSLLASENNTLYITQNYKPFILSSEQNSFEPLAYETKCHFNAIDVSDAGELLFRDCTRFYLYNPTTRVVRDLSAEFPALSPNHGIPKISADGKVLVQQASNTINKFNLDSYKHEQFDFEPYGFKAGEWTRIHDISRDGNLILMNVFQYNQLTVINEEQSFSQENEIHVLYALSGESSPMRVNISNHREPTLDYVEASTIRFDESNDLILMYGRSQDRTQYIVNSYQHSLSRLTENLNFTSGNPSALTVLSNGAHFNNISLSDQGLTYPVYRISRTHEDTGIKDFFWLQGDGFNDHQLGLRPGINTYTVTPCTINLVCDTTQSASQTIETQDFTNDERWSSSVDLNNDFINKIYLTGLRWENSTSSRIRLFNSASFAYTNDENFELGVYGSHTQVKFGVQPCVDNALAPFSNRADYRICSHWIALRGYQLPEKIRPTLFVDKQYSYVKLRFDTKENFAYHIEKFNSETQEYERIATTTLGEYTDRNILAGNYYKYQVIACDSDSDICTTGEEAGISISRRQQLALHAESDSQDSIQLTISNAFDVDTYILFRASESESYQQIATLQSHQKAYLDSSLTPNTDYWYKVQSILADEVMAESAYKVSTRSRNPAQILSDDKIEFINIDTSYAYGHLISWNEVANADAYKLKINRPDGQSIYERTLTGRESTQHFFSFDSAQGIYNSLNYSVAPIMHKCTSLEVICSDIVGDTFSHDSVDVSLEIEQRELKVPVFSVYQQFQNRFTISFSSSFIHDFYQIFRTTTESENWQPVAYLPGYDSYYSHRTLYDDAELEPGQSYHYRLKACSLSVGKCETRALKEVVTFGESYSGALPGAPIAKFEGELLSVDLNIDAQSYISRVELVALWDDTEKATWRINRNTHPFKTIDFRYVASGTEIRLKLRYCFDSEVRDVEDCTQYSEEITVVVPDFTQIVRPSLFNKPPSLDVNLDEGTIKVSGDFRTWGSIAYKPDIVTLYRATNQGEFEFLSNIEPENQDPYTYEYTDNELEPGNHYQYALSGCNSAGCDVANSIVVLFAPDETRIPQKPVITHISDGAFSNKIRVEFSATPGAEGHHLYHADEENGEYIRITSLIRSQNYAEHGSLKNDTRHWYRIEACNDFGCNMSAPKPGTTGSAFYNAEINLSGETLYQAWLGANDIGEFSGDFKAIADELDAFSGDITFSQWLDVSSGIDIESSFRPDSDWSLCSTLVDIQLFLPNIDSGYYSRPFTTNMAQLRYTGNGCDGSPELELFSFYLDSDFLAEPLLIEQDLKEQWQSLQVSAGLSGNITYYLNDELVGQSTVPLNTEAFTLSKVAVKSHQGYYESTYLRSISLSAETPEDLESKHIIKHYRPELKANHPRLLAFTLSQEFDGYVEYLSVEESSISEVNRLNIGNGRYSGLLADLKPNQLQQILLRACKEDGCGPYFYASETTEAYQELRTTPGLSPSFTTADTQLHLSVAHREREGIDNYSILRKVDEADADIIFEYDYKDVYQHWLTNRYNFEITDLPAVGAQVSYAIRACNPIGCLTSAFTDPLVMPADSDGDGVLDPLDDLPNDPGETVDTDDDGIGNNADTDDDNDGISDELEILYGMDPTNPFDVHHDSDYDGFNNYYEFIVGSDLTDADDTPEHFGIFSSFETEEEPIIIIDGVTERVFNRTHGQWGLHSRFSSPDGTDLTLTVKGKLHDGYILFNERVTNNRSLSIAIDGESIAFETEPHYQYNAINWYWDLVAIPVEASEKVVTVTLSFNGSGDDFPTEITLDELFVPMTLATEGAVPGDYTGNGRTDFVARNDRIGVNYVLDSLNSEVTRVTLGSKRGDIILNGDFNGDGVSDIAIRRPSNKTWYIKNSGDNNYNSEREDGIQRITFGGEAADIPVPADYDGDGITDVAVRRPDTYMWYIRNSSGSNFNSEREDGIQRIQFGKQANDIPVPADYDGDGKADIAVRRPGNFTWYILESSSGDIRRIQFGKQATDIPVPADYDGDGKADIAVRRPGNQFWYILKSSDNQVLRINFGKQSNDIPVVGDYDGDGKADIAVRRPASGMWYVLQSSDTQILRQKFGSHSHMIPSLAPIWEKLLLSGWGNEFLFGISERPVGRPTLDDSDAEFEHEIHSLQIDEFISLDTELGLNERGHFSDQTF